MILICTLKLLPKTYSQHLKKHTLQKHIAMSIEHFLECFKIWITWVSRSLGSFLRDRNFSSDFIRLCSLHKSFLCSNSVLSNQFSNYKFSFQVINSDTTPGLKMSADSYTVDILSSQLNLLWIMNFRFTCVWFYQWEPLDPQSGHLLVIIHIPLMCNIDSPPLRILLVLFQHSISLNSWILLPNQVQV